MPGGLRRKGICNPHVETQNIASPDRMALLTHKRETHNVFTAYILPGRSYTVALKVGTVLSQVNQQEINANMRGQEAPGKPFLVVKADDAGKTFKLVQWRGGVFGFRFPICPKCRPSVPTRSKRPIFWRKLQQEPTFEPVKNRKKS